MKTVQSTPTDVLPVERSMNAIRSIVRAMRVNTRAIELKMGISLAQLFVLQELAERPAYSLNDLAARTATHQSSVSVVVRRLVDRGFVSRVTSQSDKRRIEIMVTEAGRTLLIDAPETVLAQLVRALGAMTPTDRDLLSHLLEKWVRLANINLANTPMIGEEDTDIGTLSA